MEELWAAVRAGGQESLAGTILRHGVRSLSDFRLQARHGVRSLSDFRLKASTLLEAGVLPWQIEAVLAASHHREAPALPEQRADLPVPYSGKRASLVAALDAARPNQRQRSLAALDGDILARSTQPAHDARLRTYMAVCAAWETPPFPLTHHNIRCFGASMKAGGYRSAAVYYQSICSHQQRTLRISIDPMLRHTMRDCIRSILRGLGSQKLKDSFNGLLLNKVEITHDADPFDLNRVSHARDMCIVGLWFMMRESELASAKLGHLTLDDSEVRLMIPIHKTDCYGGLCQRVLACSCRVKEHGLCVWHAAERHLIRCHNSRGDVEAHRFPLFPDVHGRVPSKNQFIAAIRKVIQQTDTPLERQDPQGRMVHRFHGHVLRVSGAQLLFTAGVHLQLIQLLGRWTSMTILRYTQQAGLNLLPGIPDIVLNGADDVNKFSIAPAVPVEQPVVAMAPQTPLAAPVVASIAAPAIVNSPTDLHGEALQQLRDELAQLRQLVAVKEMKVVYVVRARSRIAHLGSSHELSNAPARWKTRCGWSYGLTNFLRVAEVEPPLRRCKKCFDLDSSSGSSDHESAEGFSDLEGSDDSAASD
eukprot:Skav231579  [mRNA]  locus=scaffold481:254699:256465:- [translate_table: standard]